MDQSKADNEFETPIGHASIWVQKQTMYYQPEPENDLSNYASPSATSGKGAASNAVIDDAQIVLIPCGASSSSCTSITLIGKGATGKSSSKKKDLWTGKLLISAG